MPFSISDTINGVVDGVLKSNFATSVASSPIYTAGIITIIVVLIALICTRWGSDSFPATVVRMLFWTFTATTLLMLLHDRIVQNSAEDSVKSGVYTDYVNSTPTGITDGAVRLQPPAGVIPIQLTTPAAIPQ